MFEIWWLLSVFIPGSLLDDLGEEQQIVFNIELEQRFLRSCRKYTESWGIVLTGSVCSLIFGGSFFPPYYTVLFLQVLYFCFHSVVFIYYVCALMDRDKRENHSKKPSGVQLSACTLSESKDLNISQKIYFWLQASFIWSNTPYIIPEQLVQHLHTQEHTLSVSLYLRGTVLI